MDYTRFEKPWVYKNKWNVFNDAIMTNLDLSDCVNTINGFCEHVDDVEECIQKCQDAPEKNCSHGYFIRTPDDHNYCVPLRDHVEVTFPYHRLREKNYYPIMKEMDTSFFANREKYPFPPFQPNMMFYRDNFIVKHENTGLNISSTREDSLIQDVVFSKNTSVYVQIVPKSISRSGVDDYIAVKNGDEVVLNIPGTAFVLHRSGDKIVWQLGITNSNAHENVLQIYAKDRKEGEILSFDDKIYFTSFKDILLYRNNTLEISQDAHINDTPDGFFSFVPKVEVSYCDSGVCKNISLDQAELKGYEAYYKGHRIYRSFCWLDCEGKKRNIRWFWLFGIVVVLLFIVLYFKKLLVFK